MSIRKGTTIIAGNSSPLDWTGTLQEYNIALENGTIKENMVCYITDDTLYTDDIRPEIETLNSIKANKDLSNLSEVGEKHFLNKSQITNCITEIPQNIKLELNNGTLTLKAGSEVIVPNGFEADGTTPKFDYVTVESDTVFKDVSNTTDFYFYSTVSGLVYGLPVNICFSGNTEPTSTSNWVTWYDTANNIIKSKEGSNTWIERPYSLPICIATADGTNYTSIDQIFNGMGYIGSTVWVDKGVKGLIPNGRNEDGTLRNIEYATPKLITRNWDYESNNQPFYIAIGGLQSSETYYVSDTEPMSPTNNWIMWYNPRENVMRYSSDNGKWTVTNWLFTGIYTSSDTTANNYKLTQFTQSKQPFRAVDYNDKQEIMKWFAPSSRYIDLTLGASGVSYTAPADGWVSWSQSLSGTNKGISLITSRGLNYSANADNSTVYVCAPVWKNDIFYTGYSAGTATQFRFYYAEGEI